MASIEIKDLKNNVVGSMDLSERFSMEGKGALMHEAVVSYLANQRQGTHATKTKGLVSGGGKKPWKQKHTGRARSGSSRSPLWRGGGTTFGPQPRDYSYELPKTARRTALFAAISKKIKDGEVLIVEGIKFEGPRTREMVNVLKNLGLSGGSTLVVVSEADRPVLLSARNIPGVDVICARDLNIYEVVSHKKVLATKAAMEVLEARPI